MELEFWKDRWTNGEIGFHQDEVNPYLSYFYDVKGPSVDKRAALKVFVPLCGKSSDMHWLSEKGYSVLGVECSEIAVKTFFDEQNIKHSVTSSALHQRYSSNSIDILLGDFFTVSPKDMESITDVFDRASLVALPEDMRKQYATKMSELQKLGTRMLLVTLSYNQNEMSGPPFSVSEDEVNDLYGNTHKIDKLLVKEIIEDEPRFKELGLSTLKESVYKLTRL